jgi:hypothetical protein
VGSPPDDTDVARWREAHEIRALRDMLGEYRRGAAALAAELTALRAEAERLREALREGRVLRGRPLVEVEVELDEYAQDLVGAILSAELAELGGRELEDVLLVARELAAGSVHRCPAGSRAMLRAERSPTSVRIEIQELGSHAEPALLSIVERLSERWGTERASSGSTIVWAQLASSPTG